MRGVTYPERSKRIRANLKTTLINPLKKLPEHALPALLPIPINCLHTSHTTPRLLAVIIQYHGSRCLILDHLPQHGPRWRGTLLVIIPPAQLDQHLGTSLHHVRQRIGLGALRRGVVVLAAGVREEVVGGPEAEDVGEDDLGVFAGFERQAVEVDGEEVEEVFFDQAVDELEDLVGVCFLVYGRGTVNTSTEFDSGIPPAEGGKGRG